MTGELQVHGCARLARSLTDAGLVDEFRLLTFPITVGAGERLFGADAQPSGTPPRLIAVDGPSGSGKSTLARPLAEALDAPLVRIDDFVTWQHFGAWWPRFGEQVVRPLLDGRDARYRVCDRAGDEFGDGLGEWRTTP